LASTTAWSRGISRLIRTSGVPPMVSVMSLKMRPWGFRGMLRVLVVLLAAHVGPGRGGALAGFDRRADQVPPLRPRPVVILHVVDAQQVFQHEPGVAGALADAAVGDGGLAEIDAGVGVELAQFVRTLESPVVIG